MTNNLVTFNFKSTPVRTETIDNQVWFCLIDVCDSLNLKRGSKVVDRLDEPGVRKTYLGVETGKKSNGLPAIQKVETTFINEPNLYRLIFRSNKPAALQFAKWVYEEVLPSIRKTGGYGTPAVDMRAIGGMVKRCVNKALVEFLEAAPAEKTEQWEVSDQELLYQLHCWHATRTKKDVVKMRELMAENADLKNRMSQISCWVK